MASKRELRRDFSVDAAPQTAATLPRRTHRKSSPVKPAAAATATATTPAHSHHSIDKASDAESDSSVVSTSSEEPSSESDDDSEGEDTPMDTEEIISLPLPPNADARRRIYQRRASPSSALSERLKAFLPQLAAANDELERDRAAGKLPAMENVGEGDESYIELNLGLGILKERDPNKMDSDSESDEDADDEMDTGEDEGDVLAKLMGKKKTKAGAGVQEVSGQ
ncbi:uncharacterized protein BKCO1_5100047 [Diplodia corticola]|uniref:Uncharacterized protein n=1 Tax=Diplodia corticola TaxID=236234 RepID=A0A1J9QQG6_9PEZI|nr:uncharacterized protein BKCO1_5100047 [Diplodia corticola]OJD31174.1 hypothetical protein BKCO1_5100047 [Diplodia corticola]